MSFFWFFPGYLELGSRSGVLAAVFLSCCSNRPHRERGTQAMSLWAIFGDKSVGSALSPLQRAESAAQKESIHGAYRVLLRLQTAACPQKSIPPQKSAKVEPSQPSQPASIMAEFGSRHPRRVSLIFQELRYLERLTRSIRTAYRFPFL